jgi:hypothetical protein
MTNEQLNLIRDALTGGHAGNLSAEGQRNYLAALDIIDRALLWPAGVQPWPEVWDGRDKAAFNRVLGVQPSSEGGA